MTAPVGWSVPNVDPAPLTPRSIAARFRTILAERELVVAGQGRDDPAALLRRYRPRALIELFGTHFFVADLRKDSGFSFFVCYIALPQSSGRLTGKRVYPRIFYKDSSLIWRSATHYIRSEYEHWVGKGDVKAYFEDDMEVWYSAEETTNLPYEIQSALDRVSRQSEHKPEDDHALALVLRNAPDDRVHPYQDFLAPRRRAMADPERRINDGKPVAWFSNPRKPESLRFVRGFEPDFDRGLIDISESRSNLYGGRVVKYRFASTNRRAQYLFMHSPSHVWIIPPQTVEPELTSYGVRPVDVEFDENLCIPGYEYHYLDDSVDPPELHTQLPAGFAGKPSSIDPGRADASPWNERMPVIAEFRHKVLGER